MQISFKIRQPHAALAIYYRRAVDSRLLIQAFLHVAKVHYGLNPSDIVHAASICSDDINNVQYPPDARTMIGPFNLAGLDGLSFTGLTGMKAFVHHVPDRGAILIFFAPHIGIAKDGSVGVIVRPGQHKQSACCGAASQALDSLIAGSIHRGPPNPRDYQQHSIEQILLRHKKRILSAGSKEKMLVAATEVIYEAIRDEIHKLLKGLKLECEHLFLLGGILINTDRRNGSFVELRQITHSDFRGRHVVDLAKRFKSLSSLV